MKITEKEVRYVADLANLNLTEAEVAKLRADLDGILDHIDKLNEIDTSGRRADGAGAVRRRADRHSARGYSGAAAGQRGGAGQCSAGRRRLLQSAESHRTLDPWTSLP